MDVICALTFGTRRYDELSNRPDPSSSRQFCPDYIIATPGYDFREGQPPSVGLRPLGTAGARACTADRPS